jgi:hypothetical protein
MSAGKSLEHAGGSIDFRSLADHHNSSILFLLIL